MLTQLKALDQKVFLFLNGLNAPWLNPFMEFVSGQLIWVPFIGICLFYAYQSFSKKQFFIFFLFLGLLLVITDSTSSYVLKNLTERLRPCRDLDIKPLIYSFGQRCGGRFGFVSSHAANSLALSLFCFRVLPLPKILAYFLIALPVLVSYSRIYLGVHYPGDILGGIFVATFWTTIFVYFWKNLKAQDG
ncbi:MAG TPA: phosphatase PAP2 family protein [Bacteriovoracaceae bacterium]|nr:phosphatase PAP2 family protein [Bacteriovoracaceae bacterium]